ncbi:RNA-binding protein [Lachnospiraceae bacterium NK3A20]|jgi:RNA-binding protein|nr:RNA-binding protein [Lachnospiraceae bacterium NK3A20]
MLTSKQRSFLMSLAANLVPVVQIGKAGVSPETVDSVLEAYHTRELLKINVLKTSPDEPILAADKIAKRTHSQIVKVIGRKIILYKQDPQEPKIILPR